MDRAPPPIRLTVPAGLGYRGVVIRVVTSACGFVVGVGSRAGGVQHGSDLSARFDAELVSAVSEIFNNIVIHGHDGGDANARVSVRVDFGNHCVRVRIREWGRPFDVRAVPSPDLGALPEGGLGLHIARSFLDRLDYRPGSPNVWHLKKCTTRGRAPAGTAGERAARAADDGGADESDGHDDVFES